MIRAAALSRLAALCAAVLVANAFWAIALPSLSGRIAGAFGALVAALTLVCLAFLPRFRARLVEDPPEFARGKAMFLLGAPFLLPALVIGRAPTFAFWRLDGRSALLLAWLASTAVAVYFERRSPEATGRRTRSLLMLFVVLAAGIWLTVVLDSGVGSFMMTVDRRGSRPCQSDPFTTMATVWETNPRSEHLFLAWRSQENFDHRIVYANHVHPYLLTMYGWMTAAQWRGRLTLWQASNTTILLPVLLLIGGFATLLARAGLLPSRPRPGDLLILFLATGVLLTTWRMWIDLVRFNSDNPYPLLAAMLVLIYALLLPPLRTGPAAAASAAFAALSPTYTPMLLLVIICLFGQPGSDAREVLRRNRSVVAVCAAALFAGVMSYGEPRLLIWWKGYQTQESSLLFRSGLDGDTRYFSGLFQAFVAPCPLSCCYPRTLSDLLFPAILPLAVFAPLTTRLAPSATSIGRAVLFLGTTYLVSLILFPQSVSVHPYLYDHLFIIPVVVAGLLAMLSVCTSRRLSGGAFLTLLLFLAALLMSNLIGLAQGLARSLAFFTS
jgi:hypothetical protein